MKENTVVILHACCHNPTGYDLTQEQWAQVVDVCVKNKLIPFLDIAYQGFGDGLEEDAGSIRQFADAGIPFFVSSSFSKSFSLYGDKRKEFMKECSSKKGDDGKKKLTQQQEKMVKCSKEAKEKALKGELRKKFMSDCLKNYSQDSDGPSV